MKYLSNINRIDNCWNRFGIEYLLSDVFMYFCSLALFPMQPVAEDAEAATRGAL